MHNLLTPLFADVSLSERFADAGMTVLIGLVVVFSVLILLTFIFYLFGKVVGRPKGPKPAPAPEKKTEPVVRQPAPAPAVPGSRGRRGNQRGSRRGDSGRCGRYVGSRRHLYSPPRTAQPRGTSRLGSGRLGGTNPSFLIPFVSPVTST